MLLRRIILFFLLTFLLSLASAQIVSPEVHPDHTVTFRINIPGAKQATVSVEGHDPLPMAQDGAGVWTATTPPLSPNIYGYVFFADKASFLDPQNSLFKTNLLWQGNMVIVPGDPPIDWELQDVPHGAVHHHLYKSGITGAPHDYFVYTPPGYEERPRQKYPVLYLLHGFSDMANGWTAVGMANLILDNLIAHRKASPMIVVMPLGYGVPNFASPGRGFYDRNLTKLNYTNFEAVLLKEIVPAVQKGYRARTDPDGRAICGLSMGGAETLLVALNHQNLFHYVSSFSAGGFAQPNRESFPHLNADTLNHSLKSFSICCGVSDGLITTNRALAAWLKDQNVKVELKETPGAHEWPVWRKNLVDFASTIFH